MATDSGDDLSMGSHAENLADRSPAGNRTSVAHLDNTDGMEPGERLRQKREERGLTAEQLAQMVGRSTSAVRNQENGTNGIPAALAAKYARALGTTATYLLYGEAEQAAPVGVHPVSRLVPVLGEVRAGAWSEIPDEQPEPEELLPIHMPGFEQAQLFALRIAGRSMDRHYPEGTRVVVCPAAEIGVRVGDHVVVRRRRGLLVETTLKEVVQEGTGIALWPRSTDPAFQEPFRLQSIRDSDEGPEIIGVVVASYTVRQSQQGPLINL